jgi:lipoprotein-anchoring transpeptidase ErfK/SrfK
MKNFKKNKLIFDIIPPATHLTNIKSINNDYPDKKTKATLVFSFLILLTASVIAWKISPLLSISTAMADELIKTTISAPKIIRLPKVPHIEGYIPLNNYSLFYDKSNIKTSLPWYFESQTNKKIEIDLDLMTLTTYYYDEIIEYSVAAKGPPHFSTPKGSFTVLLKRPLHFSSKSHVWMPWSIQFYGDFFMHEIPYWPDGTRLTSKYSGGCVRLNIGDAKEVYDFVEIGIPVIVN